MVDEAAAPLADSDKKEYPGVSAATMLIEAARAATAMTPAYLPPRGGDDGPSSLDAKPDAPPTTPKDMPYVRLFCCLIKPLHACMGG